MPEVFTKPLGLNPSIYKHHECSRHWEGLPVLWCGKRDNHSEHHWTWVNKRLSPQNKPMYCVGNGCQGCDTDALLAEGEKLCVECREEAEALEEEVNRHEICIGGCRPMCEHDPDLP